MTDSLDALPEDWDRALAVVAHPDDLEFGAASAIARWTAQGKIVTYLLVTDGEAGIDSMDPAECGPLRRQEEIDSAAIVGVEVVEFLGRPDGLVTADIDLRRDLAGAIRRHRPDVVISINFGDHWGGRGWNHVDHRATGLALLDAARDAGNRWLFTDVADPGTGQVLEPWNGVRFAAFSGSDHATHAVDVTDWIDEGVASLAAHHTYLEGLSDGTVGKDPGPFLRSIASMAGPHLGVEYASSFEVIDL
ncbi:MAG TPA: PIG-L family deacetylase [Microthrixaceae bacterium]|nr:PIG-L family deacetylase [Microthrixaceae bacterium]